MARLLWILLASLPFSVDAGNLHRCVSPTGAVSYQSAACGSGQRLDRLITYVPEPDSKPATRTRAGRDAAATARYAGSRGGASTHAGSKGRKKRVDACAQARQERSSSLERLGLRRTFDDLSRLDAVVRDACRCR